VDQGVVMAFRRFLVASSVARLIHGALGGEWRVEGYLNGGDQRRTHVLLEGHNGHLILEEEVQGSRVVEDIIVPRRHAEALLDACVGRLDIDRVALSINRRPAFLDRVSSRDKKVDLLTVEIEDGASQATFYPPAWVGREDTDGLFDPRTLATAEVPAPSETSVSNSGLEALLDALERGALNPGEGSALRKDSGVPRPLPVQEHSPAPSPPDANLDPSGEGSVSSTNQTRPLVEVLSGVLKNAADALPPEQSTVVNPDHWAQRRKR
jgi:CYTH domain-containing protein